MFLLALLLADGLLFVLELYIADRLGDLCSTGAHCYGDAIRHALMLIVDSTAHNLLTHDKLRRWRVFRKKKKRKCRCCPHPPQRGPALRRALLADVFSEEGGHTGRPTQPSEPLSLAARRAYRQRTKPARLQRQQESTSRTAHHPRGEPCCSLRFAWEHSAARTVRASARPSSRAHMVAWADARELRDHLRARCGVRRRTGDAAASDGTEPVCLVVVGAGAVGPSDFAVKRVRSPLLDPAGWAPCRLDAPLAARPTTST